MMNWMYWGAALAALSLLVGCGSGNDDPEEEQGTPCQLDLDCRITEQCINGMCQEASSDCASDVDCSRGEICEVGACREGCRDNGDCTRDEFCNQGTQTCQLIGDMEDCQPGLCPDGEQCNLATGECEPEPEPECSSNEECAEGEVCISRQCVQPEPECRVDAGCEAGEICEGGQCITGCRMDQDCNAGDVCEELTCVPGPECFNDNDCGTGEICQDETCVDGCRTDGQCPEHQFCDGAVCADGCRSDTQCGDNMICQENACVEGCRGELDCGEGFYCNENLCVPGCRGDQACGAGQICEDNSCVAGCRDDRNCASDQACNDNNQCVEACANDGDCDGGQICRDRLCRMGCRMDAQCASGEICEGEVCVGGCRQDAQCEAGEICEDLACERGCREDGQCNDGQICLNQACVSGCRTDGECGDGQVCLDNTCRAGCRMDGDCVGEGQVCLNNACFQGCRRDSDCGEGMGCRDNLCVAVEACNDDGYEDNDILEDATELPLDTTLEGFICAEDADIFVLRAFEGCRLRATMSYTHAAGGDLELELRDQNGAELQDSTGTSGTETITRNISANGLYYVVVYGFSNTQNGPSTGAYTVEATLENCPTPPLSCPEDDGAEDNDMASMATMLSPGGSAEGIICGEDADWFEVTVPAEGCTLSAQLSYLQSEGNLALLVQDAQGNNVGMSDTMENNELVSVADVTEGGVYRIRVSGGANSDTLYSVRAGFSGCAGATGRLLISEVFYDADSGDNGDEWVELYNDSNAPIDLSGYTLAAAGGDWTNLEVGLTGTIQPGGCLVIGGPNGNPGNGNPTYHQEVNFSDRAQGGLQNGGGTADGVALFNLRPDMVHDDTTPIDAVIYGRSNDNDLIDETGQPGEPDIASSPSGNSIERSATGWATQPSPTPGDCSALQSF